MRLIESVPDRAAELARSLAEPGSACATAVRGTIIRIAVTPGELHMTLSRNGLWSALGLPRNYPGDAQTPDDLIIWFPFKIRRRGVEARLVMGAVERQQSKIDPHLVNVLKLANQWMQQLTAEKHLTIANLAARTSVEDNEISRVLPLAFLAPDIVEAIIAGQQPVDLTARRLKRLKPLPADWSAQRLGLGFTSQSV